MKLTTLLPMILLTVVIAVSCGQKVEETTVSGDDFIYTDFAAAKSAAADSGKYLVLDFYFDT